jgi:hypothetical protein
MIPGHLNSVITPVPIIRLPPGPLTRDPIPSIVCTLSDPSHRSDTGNGYNLQNGRHSLVGKTWFPCPGLNEPVDDFVPFSVKIRDVNNYFIGLI